MRCHIRSQPRLFAGFATLLLIAANAAANGTNLHPMHSPAQDTTLMASIFNDAKSAAEQSGVLWRGQVNSVIAGLDQATLQKAALVEQSAAGADGLKEQAHRLAGAAATFRTETSTRLATSSAL